MPLFVAMISTGAMSLSKARFKKEKLSMSNMCTSSMNKTCKQIKQLCFVLEELKPLYNIIFSRRSMVSDA
jgi:hypothetical protein